MRRCGFFALSGAVRPFALAPFGVVLVACMAYGQTTADDPFKGVDKERFPEICERAVETYFQAERQYRAGNFAAAKDALDALWKRYPAGSRAWEDASQASDKFARETGTFFGSPAGYYALRMLDDCVRFRLAPAPKKKAASETVTLTVLLLGASAGVQPQSEAELKRKAGKRVERALHPLVAERNSAILHDSTWLLGEYLTAMTRGKLRLNVRPHHLPDFKTQVRVYLDKSDNTKMESYADGELARLWESLPWKLKGETDWWLAMRPTLMNDLPAFGRANFIAGGMTTAPGGDAPLFLADDLFFVRKAPHLGKGPFTDFERRLYLPQWFQHEFFHYLYYQYPRFRLEATSHQWFDRKTWPPDFNGLQEPDYYSESLHKLLKPLGDPPLHVKLKHASLPPAEVRAKLTAEMMQGDFARSPKVENDWHEGSVTLEKRKGRSILRWTNKAKVSWTMTPDFAEGVLRIGPECPYAKEPGGDAAVALVELEDGEPRIVGFRFMSSTYLRKEK